MKKMVLYYVTLNGQQLSVQAPTWQVSDRVVNGLPYQGLLPTELHVFDNVFFSGGYPRLRVLGNEKLKPIKPRKWTRIEAVEYMVGTNLRSDSPLIQTRGFGNNTLIAGLRNSEASEFHVDKADFFCWAPGITNLGIFAKPFIGYRAIAGELFSAADGASAQVRGAIAAVPCQYPWQRLMCELFMEWLRRTPYGRTDHQVAEQIDEWTTHIATSSVALLQANAMGVPLIDTLRYARSVFVFSRMAQRAALANASYMREQALRDPMFKLQQPLLPQRAAAERTDQLAIDAQVEKLSSLYSVLGGLPNAAFAYQSDPVANLNRRVSPVLQLKHQARANLYGVIGLHEELSKAFGVELAFLDTPKAFHAKHKTDTTLNGIIEPVARFIVNESKSDEERITIQHDRIIAMARIDAAIKWLRNCIPGDTRHDQDVANELESDYLMRMKLYRDKAVRRSV